MAGAGAVGPDAASVRLHQPLADRQPQAMAGPRPLPAASALAKQVRQLFRRHSRPLVGDRDGDVCLLAHRRDPDRRRFRSVPRGVGDEVAEDLHDAPGVCHHAGQTGRQVDHDGVAAAAAEERAARRLHQLGHLGGRRRHRERAGPDAPRVEQVADQAAHVIGLLDDEAGELAPLGRIERLGLLQQRHRRALDGGQRPAQLVAHQAQELGPHTLDLVQRRQVLQGHHDRLDRPVGGLDGGRVDQRAHAAPVRDRQLDLLGPHRLAAVEPVRARELAQGDLPAVGAPARDHFQQLLGRAARQAQAFHDAPRRAVERHRPAVRRIEDYHAHRRGLDEGLQAGSRLPLAAMRAGIGDRRRGLRGEQHQHLLVLVAEGLPVRLLGEEEVAQVQLAVAQRSALEGPREQRGGFEAQRTDEARQVRDAQRPGQVAQVLEQAGLVGQGQHLAMFLGGEAGVHRAAVLAGLVDGGDDAVLRAGEAAGAGHGLAEHGVKVEAGVDAQDGRVEGGAALAQGCVLALRLVGIGHGLLPRRAGVNLCAAGPAKRLFRHQIPLWHKPYTFNIILVFFHIIN